MLDTYKMICSHCNHEISPIPIGYMEQMHLVFAQTKFDAGAAPALKEGLSILFSNPQTVKNLEIKKESSGIKDKKAQTSWKIKPRADGM